jgi:hypothetical protein
VAQLEGKRFVDERTKGVNASRNDESKYQPRM